MSQAIKKQQWEVVALCLALGALESLRDLPDDSLAELLDTLEHAPYVPD